LCNIPGSLVVLHSA
jgi:CO dehydrogenase/acetyl-CoA synthase beta subunit